MGNWAPRVTDVVKTSEPTRSPGLINISLFPGGASQGPVGRVHPLPLREGRSAPGLWGRCPGARLVLKEQQLPVAWGPPGELFLTSCAAAWSWSTSAQSSKTAHTGHPGQGGNKSHPSPCLRSDETLHFRPKSNSSRRTGAAPERWRHSFLLCWGQVLDERKRPPTPGWGWGEAAILIIPDTVFRPEVRFSVSAGQGGKTAWPLWGGSPSGGLLGKNENTCPAVTLPPLPRPLPRPLPSSPPLHLRLTEHLVWRLQGPVLRER